MEWSEWQGEMMPKPRQKFQFVITENVLPEIVGEDHAGEFWFAKDSKQVYFIARNGATINLSELLLNSLPVAPARHGKDGVDGAPGVKGEKGSQGLAGRDGAGKDGVNATGIQGPQGRPGKDCVCRTELAEQRVAGIETSLRDARAETISLKAQLTTLGATVQGLLDVNKRTGEYIEWLRQRTAARIAAAQGAKQQ